MFLSCHTSEAVLLVFEANSREVAFTCAADETDPEICIDILSVNSLSAFNVLSVTSIID